MTVAENSGTKRTLTIAVAVLAAIAASLAVFLLVGNKREEPMYPVTITLEVPGLDEGSSRVPIHVSGTSENDTTVDLHAYVGMSKSDAMSLPRGTYTVEAEGSPITSQGVIYAYEQSSTEITVSGDEGADTQTLPKLELVPVEALDVTDEQIDDAVRWAQGDELFEVDAKALGETATKRRDEAVEQAEAQEHADAIVDAYNAVVDAAPEDCDWYALADVTGDDVPELLISVYPGGGMRWTLDIYVFDATSDKASQISTGTHHPNRDGFLIAPDGHALVEVGYYGSQYILNRTKVVDGEVVTSEFSPRTANSMDEIYALGITTPNYVKDLSNREPIEALRNGGSGVAQEKAQTAEGTDQEEGKDNDQQRIDEAFANNPSVLSVDDYGTVTGTVRGEYANLSSDGMGTAMAWRYWLELPTPITMVYGSQSTEHTTLDLPVPYSDGERVERWQEYLDKVLTIQAKWIPSAAGGTSMMAASTDCEVVEVY